MATERNTGCGTVIVVAALGLILGTVVWSMLDGGPPPQAAYGRMDALAQCQQAISTVARMPLDDVGYTSPAETPDGWSMVWTIAEGRLRLRNGYGIAVPAQAFCKVGRDHAITTLVIDGRVVIGG